MKGSFPLCAVLLVLALSCTTSWATTIIAYSPVGIGWDTIRNPAGGSLATSSPGSAFTLDFASVGLGADASPPYTPYDILLGFDCQTPYTSLKIKLDSDATIFQFTPTAPSTSQTAVLIYDPAYGTPTGDVPLMVMPQAWKDQLANGVLSGRVWVEGTPFAPQFASLVAQGGFVVPEPATLCLLAAGALGLIRRGR